MFRDAYAKRCCLVPPSAFREWKAEGGGKRFLAIAQVSGVAMAFVGVREGRRG